MVWLRSILVGLAALLAFCVIAAVVYPIILNRNSGSQGLIAVDWISLMKNRPVAWVLLVLIFAAGFAWQYRRLTN